MRRSSRSKWVSGIGAVVLIGGLVLANYGSGVPPAEAKPGDGDDFNWDTNNPSAKRFTVLAAFGGAAVRDNNTGLVWEQAPDTTPRKWQNFGTPLGATNYCVNKTVGGTVGWRLPSVAELKSVQDPSLAATAFVPASVVTGVQFGFYWSATTVADELFNAWLVDFASGIVQNRNKSSNSLLVWCVRGGMNADAY
jgi:hypothetical protein